jgi:hypothetical protein
MGVKSILFSAACSYFNRRNGSKGAGSSDAQGLQNPVKGGSTSRLRHEEPLIPKVWQAEVGEQMILPFKPSRFREKPVKRLKYAGYYEPTLMGKNVYGYGKISRAAHSSTAQGADWGQSIDLLNQ